MTRPLTLAALLTLAVVLLRLRVVGWGRREALLLDWVTGCRLPRSEWLALQASRGSGWRDLDRVDAV